MEEEKKMRDKDRRYKINEMLKIAFTSDDSYMQLRNLFVASVKYETERYNDGFLSKNAVDKAVS